MSVHAACYSEEVTQKMFTKKVVHFVNRFNVTTSPYFRETVYSPANSESQGSMSLIVSSTRNQMTGYLLTTVEVVHFQCRVVLFIVKCNNRSKEVAKHFVNVTSND